MNSLLLVSPLLIYFPRILPGIETQPWLAVGLAAWAFWCDPKLRGASAALGIVVAACFCVFALVLVGGVSSGAAASTLQFTVGPVLLCALATGQPLPPERRWCARLALILAGVALVEVAAPAAYAAVAGTLLDRVSLSDGHRGISLLTPEPTYASLALAYALMLSLWSRRCWGGSHSWVEWLLASLLFLTFSTYALLILMTIVFIYRPLLALSGLSAALPLGYGYLAAGVEAGEGVRAVVALSKLLEIDRTAVLASLSIVDPSLGYRATSIAAGPASAIAAPMGFGLGCNSVSQAFDVLRWDFVLTDEVIGPALQDGCLKPSSYMTSILIAYGVMALVFISVIVMAVRHALGRSPGHVWWPGAVVALEILIVQSQVTTPVPWFILYMALVPARAVFLTPTVRELPQLPGRPATVTGR